MQAGLLRAPAVTSLARVHTFIGGVYVARPLLSDQSLPTAAKWLAYCCWHIVTMLLLAIGVGFSAAAMGWLTHYAAFRLVVSCAACSLLSIAIALKAVTAPWRFPPTTLSRSQLCFGLADGPHPLPRDALRKIAHGLPAFLILPMHQRLQVRRIWFI
jgi:hypothetical protein